MQDVIFHGAMIGYFQIANGLTRGVNAQIWREINTGHHITKVLSDLDKIYGFTVQPAALQRIVKQEDLFPVE